MNAVPESESIRVLVVDDDDIVRRALASYIDTSPDLELVATASDGEEALGAPPVDIVLMDVHMPRMDGVTATRELRRRDSRTRVIVLTAFDQYSYLQEALEAGASGFLLKVSTPEALVEAVRAVHCGHTVMSPASTDLLLHHHQDRHRPTPMGPPDLDMSARQQAILTELCKGSSNAEIATVLCLSESTVKTHVSAIMGKLDSGSRLKAVVRAHEWGLVGR